MTDSHGPLTRDDHDAIRHIVEEEFTQGALTRNWDRLLATLAPDVTYMPADHSVLHGHAAVREFFQQFPTIVGFTQPVEHIEGDQNMAFTRSSFSATVEIAGQRLNNTGKAMGWFVRDAAGAWIAKSVCFNWDRPFSS